ncbi:MAG: xanthan lyase [Alistipes sp.]|nr:xanthan lyase [Alistipes sp.]
MKGVYRYIATILFLALIGTTVATSQTLPKDVSDSICAAIRRITLPEVAGSYVKVESVRLRERGDSRVVEVSTSQEMEYYPMRSESIERIYDEVRRVLPKRYRDYTLLIYSRGRLIDELVPQYYFAPHDAKRFTHKVAAPLISRTSNISQPTKGLTNRHIALWQSHGRYFNNNTGEWSWQRSRLWETVEDLYTQSYVLPFLVPMLERAGATVLLPRERSTSRHEVIIDNDEGIDDSRYTEHGKWQEAGVGFAHLHDSYPSGHNPFEDGTARMMQTTASKAKDASAVWGGTIPEAGIYTVYVSYITHKESVTDAHYTVHATGGEREFRVNQQMGGSMWVALGDFYFAAGKHDALVTLSNTSAHKGVVTADAVKIGGGMGNIRRSVDPTLRKEGIEYTEETSNYPRFTEGARYWLQWSGFTTDVYAPKEGRDDYRDDYMSRAHWVNNLMDKSSKRNKRRGVNGKNIPIDLAFAFHSDAGVRLNDDIIGTLGIYCTKENGGEFHDDISRLRSRDLTDIVMSQIVNDIRLKYEPQWTRRGMWDRAYYEARMPKCPTMLLELLSHQNFADMRYGHDPSFRFDISRAIYKGMLRYLSSQYAVPYVVQPLPVNSFAALLRGNEAHLSWAPTTDALEPTASPDYYILYTRIEDGGFDNGRRIDGTTTTVKIDAGKLYSFRITAVNEGGESFDSETLTVARAKRSKGDILVINGFDRVAAPLSVQGDSIAGSYNRYDSGAAYINDISFIGEQTIFDRSLSRSENDNYALGTSYNDYEQEVIAGNTFDYPALHGRAIVEAGYSFCSSSHRAVAHGSVALDEYDVVDLILGKQRTTSIGRGTSGYHFEAMSHELQQVLRNYAERGGALLVSGSYLLTDLWHAPTATADDRAFAEEVLHVRFGGNMATRRGDVYAPASRFSRKNLTLQFNTELSEDIYAVESPEVVTPVGSDAFVALRYRANAQSAAVASAGTQPTLVVGFPIETIRDENERNKLMSIALKFLTESK